MQVVEVDDVVLHELDAFQQVAEDACIIGDRDAQGILDCPHRSDGMHGSAHAAHALGKEPGVARIAALHDGLQAAEGCAGAPGIGHFAIGDGHFEAQMALNTGDRIDRDLARAGRQYRRRLVGRAILNAW